MATTSVATSTPLKRGLRVPVLVDRELYDSFKAYSELTGVPVARVVREALEDFKETSMEARLDSLTPINPDDYDS